MRVQEHASKRLKANHALQAEPVQRQRAEEMLREGTALLAAVIGSATDAIIATGADQRIILFNAAAELMFHCTAAEAMGQPIERFIPEEFRRAHRDHVRAVGLASVTSRRIGVLRAGLRAGGEEFPAEVAISQVEVAGRKLYTAVVRDLTERERAGEQLRSSREQLRALAGRVEAVREEERSRIAREIHDELGQALTGLKIDVSRLAASRPGQRAGLEEKTRAMGRLIDGAIRSVRRISMDLRPGVLDDLGLGAAIEWQAQDFQARTGIVCQVALREGDLHLDGELSTGMFRVFQEMLANVARHANATRVDVTLETEADRLILAVRDNGRGITEREISDPRSLGLLGMRERALLLGGEVTFAGVPGQCTTVTMSIPLQRPRSDGESTRKRRDR